MRIVPLLLVFLAAAVLLSSTATADNDDEVTAAEVKPLHYRCREDGGRRRCANNDRAYLTSLKALYRALETKARMSKPPQDGAAAKSYGEKVRKLVSMGIVDLAANSSEQHGKMKAWFAKSKNVSILVYLLMMMQCKLDIQEEDDDCRRSCLLDLVVSLLPAWFYNETSKILTIAEIKFGSFVGLIVFMLFLSLTSRGIIQRIKGDWHNKVTRENGPKFSFYHFPTTRDTISNISEEGCGSFGLVYRALLVILTALLLSSTAGAAAGCYSHENMTRRVKPLYYDCGCFGATNGVDYYNNRTSLAGKLVSNLSASPGNFFASHTVGSVHGFVLCRGDYNGSVCADSLNQTINDYIVVTNNSTSQIICQSSMGITIYYDQHMLSFSGDEYIYSDPAGSNRPAWVASNMNYVMNGTGGAAGLYAGHVQELLDETAGYAALNSSKLYATGKSWFGEAGVSIIYGLVQCRPDMKRDLCRQCLGDLVSKIPEEFTTEHGDHCVGGRILGVWCNVRFESELFFKEDPETRKLHKPKSRLSKVNIALITIAGFVVFALCLNLLGGIIRRIRDRKLQRELGEWHGEVTREIDSMFSLYDFSTIRGATGNFSEENKLGRGSFGFVYRGILPDGVQIAAKRLDASSWQGSSEFLNEIKLIVRLQHANLVRLLGCCLQRSEMILVYEYMPNRSLDYVFSDPVSRDSLNWSKRLRVIDGIAEGLVYLHNFSEPHKFIIHRDMKLSNILLDSEMNPKISDFGISRIYDLGAVEPEPTDVVGTRGYMAPEYNLGPMLTVKYDVFSFGVLLLEIISGRKVSAAVFTAYGRSDHLLTHAWHIWRGGRYSQLVDPSLRGVYDMLELRRRIQIALLCIQENPDHRPNMREVTTMLSNNDVSLPVPHPPGYFNRQLGEAEASASNNGTTHPPAYFNIELGDAEASASNNDTMFYTSRTQQAPQN